MSNPSYLPDDSSINAETDNSHVLSPDVETFDVTDVDSSGITFDVETPARFGDGKEPLAEYEDLPSFFRTFSETVAKSHAGTLARQDVLLVDSYHRTNAEDYNQWLATAKWFNTGVPNRDETVGEMLAQATEDVYHVLWSNYAFLSTFAGDEPEESYEDASDSRLWELADAIVEQKCVWEPYFGAKVEEAVAEELCRRFDVSEWYAHSDEITARTGIQNPEREGIDIFLPEIDRTVQVKLGGGGPLPDDCNADWGARYFEPEQGREEYEVAVFQN